MAILGVRILVMKDLTSPSPTFIQPTEFNALNHEKQFKIVIFAIFVFIILYVSAGFGILGHFADAGALFKIGWLKQAVMTEEAGMATVTATVASWFIRASLGVTALSMLTSIACGVYANRGFATPNPSNALIQVNIPFSILNLTIALGIGLRIVVDVLFNLFTNKGALSIAPPGDFHPNPIPTHPLIAFVAIAVSDSIFYSAVLLGFLLCNQRARKHVALRVRQLIDGLTVGGTNSFDPIVSLALAVRALIERFTVGGHNSVGPMASIAVVGGAQVAQVPLQLSTRWARAVSSARYAVTLPEFLDVMDVTETSM